MRDLLIEVVDKILFDHLELLNSMDPQIVLEHAFVMSAKIISIGVIFWVLVAKINNYESCQLIDHVVGC